MKSESEFIENADNSSSKYQLFDISLKIDPDTFNDSLYTPITPRVCYPELVNMNRKSFKLSDGEIRSSLHGLEQKI